MVRQQHDIRFSYHLLFHRFQKSYRDKLVYIKSLSRYYTPCQVHPVHPPNYDVPLPLGFMPLSASSQSQSLRVPSNRSSVSSIHSLIVSPPNSPSTSSDTRLSKREIKYFDENPSTSGLQEKVSSYHLVFHRFQKSYRDKLVYIKKLIKINSLPG